MKPFPYLEIKADKTIKKEVAPFDVDDTLIMTSQGQVPPDSPFEVAAVVDPLTGSKLHYKVNEPMVRLLKEEKAAGNYVIVWSRGRSAWAEAVVKALGLYDTVDLILSKPMAYFDDKPIDDWLRYRVYINSDVPYKNK